MSTIAPNPMPEFAPLLKRLRLARRYHLLSPTGPIDGGAVVGGERSSGERADFT